VDDLAQATLSPLPVDLSLLEDFFSPVPSLFLPVDSVEGDEPAAASPPVEALDEELEEVLDEREERLSVL
jgi:hypothetical protein